MAYSITFDACTAEIRPVPPPELQATIKAATSFIPADVEFSPKHVSNQFKNVGGKVVFNKQAQWDGRVHLVSFAYKRTRVPMGLLEVVCKLLGVRPPRLPVAPHTDTPFIATLHDHQTRVVNTLLANPRAIVEAATSSGKSVMMAELTQRLNQDMILITAPGTSLIEQLGEEIQRWTGEEVGWILSGKWNPKRITCANIEMLQYAMKNGATHQFGPRLEKYLEGVTALFVDEVHTMLRAEKLCAAMPNAYRRHGFTGTFIREDGREPVISSFIGPVAVKVPPMELIQKKLIAVPNIRLVQFHHPDFDPRTNALYTDPATGQNIMIERKKSYDEVYNEIIAQSERRGVLVRELIREQLESGKKPILVLVVSLDHGRYINRLLEAAGMPTGFLMGADTLAERRKAIEALRTGKTDIVIASTIFDIGINIPELRSGILAGGGAAVARAGQRAGRLLRLAPGKTEADIIDIQDMGTSYFEHHSRIREIYFMSTFGEYVSAERVELTRG